MPKLLLIEANDNARWVGARVGPKVHVMPIALMGLAAYAKSVAPNLEVRIVETSLDAADDVTLGKVISEFAPTWIGVRSISLFVEEVRRVVRLAKSVSDAPLLLGGPISTAYSERIFDIVGDLEFAAIHEGEAVIEGVVRGRPWQEIAGIISKERRGRSPVTFPVPPGNLDELPLPDYSLINIDRYSSQLSYAYNQRRQGVLLTSRGCPYRCTYCFQISEAPVRMQSAERVVSEISHLYHEYGIRDFYVVDDVFNLHKKRALSVFSQLKAAKIPIRLYFVNGLRVDRCDPEFIDEMVAAGTVWVTFAIESACPRIQRYIKKPLDLEQARRIINYSQRQGIVVNVNTMYGFPTETAEEAGMTLEYIRSLEHPSLLPYHFNLRGYPGCEIVDQAEAAGWERERFLASGNSSYGDLPSGSPTFSRREMMEHMLRYHEQFGLANREHMQYAVRTLLHVGYSESEILDMFTVLNNRTVKTLDELTTTTQTNPKFFG
jgi:anaerobic magnesium-protoporphyrin IX monomethyl ester cyclase